MTKNKSSVPSNTLMVVPTKAVTCFAVLEVRHGEIITLLSKVLVNINSTTLTGSGLICSILLWQHQEPGIGSTKR